MATPAPSTLNCPSKRGRTDEVFKFFGKSHENFPKFHIIHCEKADVTARVISPFLVARCLADTIGPGYKITKMASGDLLVELQEKVQYNKLDSLVAFGDIPITVSPHRSLNKVRGVISENDLMYLSETEPLEEWKEQNVIDVQRIKIRCDNKEIPTKHIILTFDSSTLPESIEAGYVKIRVRPYVPNPLRCFKCQIFGHS